jgi:hypothetical protein
MGAELHTSMAILRKVPSLAMLSGQIVSPWTD